MPNTKNTKKKNNSDGTVKKPKRNIKTNSSSNNSNKKQKSVQNEVGSFKIDFNCETNKIANNIF